MDSVTDERMNPIEASPLVINNYVDLNSGGGGGGATTSVSNTNALIAALGIPPEETISTSNNGGGVAVPVVMPEETISDSLYEIVPNPHVDQVDLSDLRGVAEQKKHHHHHHRYNNDDDEEIDEDEEEIDGIPTNMSDTDLENLAELVPDIKTRTAAAAQLHHPHLNMKSSGSSNNNHQQHHHVMNTTKVILSENDNHEQQVELVNSLLPGAATTNSNSYEYSNTAIKNRSTGQAFIASAAVATTPQSMKTVASKANQYNNQTMDSSLHVMNDSIDLSTRNNNHTNSSSKRNGGGGGVGELDFSNSYKSRVLASPISLNDHSASRDDDDDENYADSEHALEDATMNANGQPSTTNPNAADSKISNEFMNIGSSANSISTATQTHEVRMPMYLKTFKPATGCTNASDFIVRCFVARLRSGITVVKHGRSRWCKSRLRVLHIHPDGRSLSWKPAEGEPSSSKRPPKLDLSTCLEVRHAWSPDPQNPMYTGTPILRQKCEAANAHKSFALIFKQRTVDITAVTADQCKVLMEGFSALCFRLQVANLAGRTDPNNKKGGVGNQHARPMPEEDGVSTTASATLTNTSIPKVR